MQQGVICTIFFFLLLLESISGQILEPKPILYKSLLGNATVLNLTDDGIEDYLVFSFGNFGRTSRNGIFEYKSYLSSSNEELFTSRFIPIEDPVTRIFEVDLENVGQNSYLLQMLDLPSNYYYKMLVKQDDSVFLSDLDFYLESNEKVIEVFDRTNDGYDDLLVYQYADFGQHAYYVYEYNSDDDSYDKILIRDYNPPFGLDEGIYFTDSNNDDVLDIYYINDIGRLEVKMSTSDSNYSVQELSENEWSHEIVGFNNIVGDDSQEFVFHDNTKDSLFYIDDFENLNRKPILSLPIPVDLIFFDYDNDGFEDIYSNTYKKMARNINDQMFVELDTILPFRSSNIIKREDGIEESVYIECFESLFVKHRVSEFEWQSSFVFFDEIQVSRNQEIHLLSNQSNDSYVLSSQGGDCLYSIPVNGTDVGNSNKMLVSDEVMRFDFGDFNGDNVQDLVVLNWGLYGDVYISYGNEDGSFSKDVEEIIQVDNGRGLAVADFNSDQEVDIAIVSLNGDSIVMLYGNSGSFDVEYIPKANDLSFNDLLSVDANLDGHMDLIAQEGNSVVAYMNDGEGSFYASNLDVNVKEMYLLDFDNDGEKELICLNNDAVYVFRYEINGVTEYLKLESEYCSHSSEVLFFDYDGDDYIDVMIEDFDGFNLAHKEFVVFRNLGNLEFENVGYFHEIVGWNISNFDQYFPVDFDLDGDLDMLYTDAIGLNLIENAHNEATYVGKVFWDENQDMSYQDDEAAIPNIPVQLISQEQDTTVVYTNYDGIFRFLEEEGVYDLSIPMNLNCWSSESFDEQIVISGEVNDSVYHHPIVNEGDGLELSTSFTSSPTRCGFTVKYNYSINNTGCSRVKANVKLALDQLIENISGINLLNYELSDNVLTYEIEDLLPNESSRFSFFVEVPGVEYIGETMIDSMQVYYGEYDAEVLSNKEVREYRSTINCAYDPNDKMIEPNRSLNYDANYVLDEELIYKIRFQNTGTDTAFNIFLIDTISKNLDLSTFVPMNSSHPYRLELDQELRVLRINYDDILLPDSTVNEAASHGFFNFSIRPKENLDDGTKITNSAYIYFDFNYPIVTNRVDAIYVNELPNPVSTIEQNEGGFVIYPNPVSRWIHLLSEDEILKIDLLDVNGNYLYSANDTSIYVGELSQGFYLIRVLTKMGYITQRFVKM